MSLFQLPPEIVSQIFDHVGRPFFCEDTRRLTVCKRWLAFALREFYSSVTLSQADLRHLVFLRDPKIYAALSKAVTSIEINITGYNEADYAKQKQKYPLQETLPPNVIDFYEVLIEGKREWAKTLNHDLTQLTTHVLQHVPRLRTLRIQTSYSSNGDSYLSRATFLNMVTTTVAATRLTTLVLDLPVAFSYKWQSRDEKQVHFCEVISSLLDQVEVLHLRCPFFCEQIFRPLPSNKNDDNNNSNSNNSIHHDKPLRLREYIVNFRMTGGPKNYLTVAHRCGRPSLPFGPFVSIMCYEAKRLVKRMSPPRKLRLLSYSTSPGHRALLQIPPRPVRLLPNDASWDNESTAIQEEDVATTTFDDGIDDEEVLF